MVRLFWIAMVVVFVGAAVVVFLRDGGDAVALDETPPVSAQPREKRPVPREESAAPIEQGVEPARELHRALAEDPAELAGDERVVTAGEERREPIDIFAIDTDAGASLDALLGLEQEPAPLVEDGQDGTATKSDDERGENNGAGAARLVDGGAVLGERFEVRGAGTAGEPYTIGWDVLMSAQETYRPRQGKKEIPAWVQQIDGKYVRVDGFIVLPVMGGVMNEVLLARNEWDGCCIGVPPTAYDSIEVRLRTDGSQAGGRHAVNYGSIVGKVKVDPYLWKDWLISMYVMEDAVIERQGL